jgi:type II secretory pathway component GspD/PulD (secretin)
MDVRRIAEIIDAIDTSIASSSAVRVFPLRFADAKSLASLVKELFTVDSNRGNGGNGAGQDFPAFGGGPGGGAQGGQSGNRNSANSSGMAGTKVVAVADEHSNSLIVSAVDDLIPTIQRLVRSLDVTIQDISEARIFRLQNADPNEMADVISTLFPDESTSNQSQQSGFQFGGPGGPPGGQISAQSNTGSERQKKQGRVITVPDSRTHSLIVNTGKDLMTQIAEMIAKLDADGSRKQKVFVYSLENASAQNVEDILRTMFESNSAQQSSRNSSQNNDALANRANQIQQTSSTTGFGNSGSGGQGQSSGSTP